MHFATDTFMRPHILSFLTFPVPRLTFEWLHSHVKDSAEFLSSPKLAFILRFQILGRGLFPLSQSHILWLPILDLFSFSFLHFFRLSLALRWGIHIDIGAVIVRTHLIHFVSGASIWGIVGGYSRRSEFEAKGHLWQCSYTLLSESLMTVSHGCFWSIGQWVYTHRRTNLRCYS